MIVQERFEKETGEFVIEMGKWNVKYIEWLESLLTWIPVSERLPENTDEVLVYEKYSDYPFVGYYKNGIWHVDTDFIEVTGDALLSSNVVQKLVTHWLPIPRMEEE